MIKNYPYLYLFLKAIHYSYIWIKTRMDSVMWLIMMELRHSRPIEIDLHTETLSWVWINWLWFIKVLQKNLICSFPFRFGQKIDVYILVSFRFDKCKTFTILNFLQTFKFISFMHFDCIIKFCNFATVVRFSFYSIIIIPMQQKHQHSQLSNEAANQWQFLIVIAT